MRLAQTSIHSLSLKFSKVFSRGDLGVPNGIFTWLVFNAWIVYVMNLVRFYFAELTKFVPAPLMKRLKNFGLFSISVKTASLN